MTTYQVSWEIELDATNPREAAEDAWETFFKHDHTANVFVVNGETIDLNTRTCLLCGRILRQDKDGWWMDDDDRDYCDPDLPEQTHEF